MLSVCARVALKQRDPCCEMLSYQSDVNAIGHKQHTMQAVRPLERHMCDVLRNRYANRAVPLTCTMMIAVLLSRAD